MQTKKRNPHISTVGLEDRDWATILPTAVHVLAPGIRWEVYDEVDGFLHRIAFYTHKGAWARYGQPARFERDGALYVVVTDALCNDVFPEEGKCYKITEVMEVS